MNAQCRVGRMLAVTIAVTVVLAASVRAHHSFAMYDLKITKVFTGVVTRVDPSVNHLQIYFAPMNAERKNVERNEAGQPIVWSVEMEGSAQMAKLGVSVNSFPPGTVFSVGLHPLRNGQTAGSREGGMFRCPDKTPPAPGMHCDSVQGHTAVGNAPLPKPTE